MHLNNVWKKLKLESEHMYLLNSKPYKIQDGAVVLENDFVISTNACKKLVTLKITYKIYSNAHILVDITCTSSKGKFTPKFFYPRFGAVIEMPKEYDNVTYFGLGPFSNLPDYNAHCTIGEYTSKVDDMREKYIKPQEASMRSNVKYAKVTNDNGAGLLFTVSGYNGMIFSADHFTSQQCAKAMHQEDLKICDTTVLHLDAYQLGAGSNSCGPIPTKEYRKNNIKGENISFLITPITNGEI
jgi:beta-galactosidase